MPERRHALGRAGWPALVCDCPADHRRAATPIIQPVAELIAAARLLIDKVGVHEAAELQRLDAAILIDLRDVRELQEMGTVPGAFHAPRGMLEFWADPDSPYHKPVFRTEKKLVMFCASGLRSALAVRTLQEMGMENVLDMEGGFTEWKMQDLPVDYLT